MLKTNEEKLPKISVQGKIIPPFPKHIVSWNGKSIARIGMGGICYNIKVGDPAFGWTGDHLEPGVTVALKEKIKKREEMIRLHLPACVGNKATIKKDEKDIEGIVTGLHSGILIDFSDASLKKLSIGDKILIKSYGLGLKLYNFPSIKLMNLDPLLFAKIAKRRENKVEAKIVKSIPPELMGSGLGITPSSSIVDYDLMTSDEKALKQYKLEDIKIGDIVAIEDHFAQYGPCYLRGSITIGVIVHGDSAIAGHGPGVLPLMTTKKRVKLKLVRDVEANIGRYLSCGRCRD